LALGRTSGLPWAPCRIARNLGPPVASKGDARQETRPRKKPIADTSTSTAAPAGARTKKNNSHCTTVMRHLAGIMSALPACLRISRGPRRRLVSGICDSWNLVWEGICCCFQLFSHSFAKASGRACDQNGERGRRKKTKKGKMAGREDDAERGGFHKGTGSFGGGFLEDMITRG